jgi:F0F1-type ATP synthase assembly protein I
VLALDRTLVVHQPTVTSRLKVTPIPTTEKQGDAKRKATDYALAMGIAIGAGMGLLFGTVLGSLTVGISVGVVVGLLIGLGVQAQGSAKS